MADPILSPDGNWVWNGSEWQPFSHNGFSTTTTSSDSVNPKLVTCPDCGTKISKRALSCPKCGAPRKMSLQTAGPYPSADYKWRALIFFNIGIFFYGIFFFFFGFSSSLYGAYVISPIFSFALMLSGYCLIRYLQLVSAWKIKKGIDNSTSVIGIYILMFSIVIPSLFASIFIPISIIWS